VPNRAKKGAVRAKNVAVRAKKVAVRAKPIYEGFFISAKFGQFVPKSFFSMFTQVSAEIVPTCAKLKKRWNTYKHRPTRELVPKCQLFSRLQKRM
jgi:hypothetical protein